MKISELFWVIITWIAVVSMFLYIGVIGVLPIILALVCKSLWLILWEFIAIPVVCMIVALFAI